MSHLERSKLLRQERRLGEEKGGARNLAFSCFVSLYVYFNPSISTLIPALDALANIEQYAIDLAWDIIARFAHVEVNGERLPVEFFLDWAKVAEDEAKHYTLLARRLVVCNMFQR